MTGITGIYHADGRAVSTATLGGMMDTINHRGPDGRGVWHDGHVGVGHQQLVTTPESRYETQPTVTDGADIVLVADARLDNRAALIADLDIDTGGGIVTDSELIVSAYEQWGVECAEHLVGAFAFAIWDGEREHLVCARDHMGVKPFYYHHADGTFAFGSELKAVLAVEKVPDRVDKTRVADHLLAVHEDTERTFYRDINRLPPAHTLVVSPDGAETRQYWALDPDRELQLGSDAAYAAAFKDRFEEAVRCRLRSTKPVGALLSGGLDSSSIACTARQLLPGERALHTVSAVFDDLPECDERSYIETVLESGAFSPHFVRADKLSPLVDLDAMLWHHDRPLSTPNHYLHWALYRTANKAGVGVLLDGIDGDTTVSHGRGHMAELATTGQFWRLWKEVGGFAENFDRPIQQVVFNRVLGPLAPGPVRWVWRAIHGRPGPIEAANPTLDYALGDRLDLEDRVNRLVPDLAPGRRSPREQHYDALTSGVIPFVFEHTDYAAAAFEIEPRYPFFDKRLVEFCLALPTDQKIQDGWTRLVLRRAMEGVLPERVQWRGGKADLSANFHRNLRRDERDRLASVVFGEHTGIDQFVDAAALRAEFEEFESADEPGRAADVGALWTALTGALWYPHRENRATGATAPRELARRPSASGSH